MWTCGHKKNAWMIQLLAVISSEELGTGAKDFFFFFISKLYLKFTYIINTPKKSSRIFL